MATEYYVILKLIEEKNDTFSVISILNARGFIEGIDPKYQFKPEGRVVINGFFKNSAYANSYEMIRRGELIDTKIKESGTSYLKSYEIDDEYGIKPVHYLVDYKWVNGSINQFYNPYVQVLTPIKKYIVIRPIDLANHHMFDEISQSNDSIILANSKAAELKEYEFNSNVDHQLVRIPGSKNEYCMTQKAYSKLNGQEIGSIDMLSVDDLSVWLRDIIKNSVGADSTIDLFSELDRLIPVKDEIVKNRIERCKQYFKKNILSASDIDYFLSQSDWKKAIEREKSVLISKRDAEVEKEIQKEKTQRIKEIETELEGYKDTLISEKIEAQKAHLKSLVDDIKIQTEELQEVQAKIKEGKEKLITLTSDIQKQELGIIDENIKALKILTELEIEKSKSAKNTAGTTGSEKTWKVNFEFYPGSKEFIEVEELDSYSRLVGLKLDSDIKKSIVSPLTNLASIVPNISYAYALAHFAGNCYVHTITVEHGWYHFEDFVRVGLVDFWNEALKNPDNNYVLVLQNINMIPVCSSLQPLMDVINGKRVSIPGSIEMKVPSNLRIIATIVSSKDEGALGLPLEKNSYCNFNFVGNPNDEIGLSISKILETSAKNRVCFKDFLVEPSSGFDSDGFKVYSAY